MTKRSRGFTILELLIVMLIMGFVLTAGSNMFVGLLRGYKQQSKIAETNVEGIIGLEMLRRDIDNAGYGLPWNISGASYLEATGVNASAYNDSSSNPPRAILSGFDANGRAYLVIKAMNIGGNNTCLKWTQLLSSGATTLWTTTNPASDNLTSSDRVIVISPGTPVTNSRALVVSSGTGTSFTQFGNLSGFSSPDETRIVYGVNPTSLRMPFNRADYYVSTSNPPGRCASGTGVLYKAVVSQGDGSFPPDNILPLLDCVADMQVVTYLDTDGDGTWDTISNGLGGVNAVDAITVRNQLKEVRVYVLAHEGQRDTSYAHPTNSILVGASPTFGRIFDLTTIPDWQYYRWKVYTLVVMPSNLR
jgi:prepilin-type N-terminal cleavage/methylation domain-containing protein